MTVREIYDFSDSLAPFLSQAPWDNSGLAVGDPDAEVSGVYVCLDVTDGEITAAQKAGANLIISHHPLIFSPVKNVLAGSALYRAICEGISVICAHTNLDKAPGGVNDVLCEMLKLDYKKMPETVADGFLNVGTPDGQYTPAQFADVISQRLGASVRFVPAGGGIIKKVGVCSGSAPELYAETLACGCDAFVTGDCAYHKFTDAAAEGITVFAAGHFETENPAMRVFAEKIKAAFPSLEITVSDRKPPVLTAVQ